MDKLNKCWFVVSLYGVFNTGTNMELNYSEIYPLIIATVRTNFMPPNLHCATIQYITSIEF